MRYWIRRFIDGALVGGIIGTIGLAVYIWVRPETETQDECIVQDIGGVHIIRCLTSGVAQNTYSFPVWIYVGMRHQSSYGDTNEMNIGSFFLRSGEEKVISVLMQSDRYVIYIYDQENHLIEVYAPEQGTRENGQRKTPL